MSFSNKIIGPKEPYPIITTLNIKDFYKGLSDVRLLETVNIIDTHSFVYPYYVKDNSNLIPEFMPISNIGNSYIMKRLFYSMSQTSKDRLTCCLSIDPYYIVNGQLRTCDPLSKDFTITNYCDGDMIGYCFNNPNTSKCIAWLYYAMDRMEPTINEVMQPYCTNNLFTPICETYINGLRKNGNAFLIDFILTNVWNRTKDTRLNCSFNNFYPNKVNAPKVCWNYECMNTPDYLLLTQDFNNKQFCNLYSCNIILANAVINNKSSININCNSQSNKERSLLKIALADKRTNLLNYFPYLVVPFMLLFT